MAGDAFCFAGISTSAVSALLAWPWQSSLTLMLAWAVRLRHPAITKYGRDRRRSPFNFYRVAMGAAGKIRLGRGRVFLLVRVGFEKDRVLESCIAAELPAQAIHLRRDESLHVVIAGRLVGLASRQLCVLRR